MNEKTSLSMTRRAVIALALLLAPATAGAQDDASRRQEPLPIVFVHGNGDSKAVWTTALWRFESNGYPRDRLFAIELSPTSARTVDAVPQPGRSSTEDVKDQLAAFVRSVLRRTGAEKVALVGNSRGSNTIRNYVKNGGGREVVARVVVGGGVNHGVIKSDTILVGSEFNGNSEFIRQLNAGPNEVVDGVRFLTLRSNGFDKFAQPDGKYLGLPGVPTGITFAGPALKGARNLVLPRADHREVSFSPDAFAETYRFITGDRAKRMAIRRERVATLNGEVTGALGTDYTNAPVRGAMVTVYEVDPKTGLRLGGPLRKITTKADGRWGPLKADPRAYHEFVVEVAGLPVTHLYRSPFARGSRLITLRPSLPPTDPALGSVVTAIRPRGYFGFDDTVLLNGSKPESIPNDPVPSVADATVRLPFGSSRPVKGRFENELITARTWPAGEVAVIEFTY